MKRIFVPLFLLILFSPMVSAHYYILLDENVSGLYPYAQVIAELHNGTVVVSNFSDLTFLSSDDYALLIVSYYQFNEHFVYSIYDRLDFDGDGIYDPAVGFLPVRGSPDIAPLMYSLREFRPDGAIFLRAGKVEYDEYLRLSENASLVWLEGHGSPFGVNMGSWGLYPSRLGNPSGKAFVLESCDVGKVWETGDSLVFALLRKGSPSVVASIDMGGVSYLPEQFWASGYPMGKLVQISNAYFMKVGVRPKVVLFGDPALVPVNSSEYLLVKSPETGFYSKIFPRINGYIYTPGEPGLRAIFRAYNNLFSVMDLWEGLFTMGGIGFIVLVIAFAVIFGHIHPGKKTLLGALVLATVSFLLLGAVMYYPPLNVSIQIVLFWTAVAVFMERKVLWGLLALLLPPMIIASGAVLLGTATPSYGGFLVFVSLLTSLIVLALLFVSCTLFGRIANL
ncbi:immunoglobulin domain-containing family protein [Thermococcus thioreducens]|uniref:Gingipain domain-containing protein n=1 Tax=Thermococcus thioreducens TaxID=277988 RepID=A0A0Q2S881_9EURY|nr:hypothetical protein [Thermococcus thioreducens]ASJ11407.1 hypothetical protein A3L14_00240 [Thermococcus thioreducens]KQH83427.1 hypothetical protein AMR53_00245 [Thermococcus thioreducens]SEW07252.1 hypothetical protein SAMN05216170_1391 [Thermococcus thioreducens]